MKVSLSDARENPSDVDIDHHGSHWFDRGSHSGTIDSQQRNREKLLWSEVQSLCNESSTR